MEPETRVGICCGDACRKRHDAENTWHTDALYKIPGVYRYRCDGCFQVEMGYRHHLAPRVAS